MKAKGRRMSLTLGLAIIAVLGVLAFIRLAPSDRAVWHVDMAAAGFRAPANGHVFCVRPDSGFGPVTDGAALLAKLDAVALATPRTTRLAGSAAEGRITWVTRSAVMGYPDYTTAQVMAGPSLCILGRQRFGSKDLGVNAARIGGWAQAALGLDAPPAMTGF
jgi:Protein of unknown function (DUF1499)